MKFAIIGAGIAGLACTELLVREGHEVQLFDKGRGPGGRLSTRRVSTPLGEASFDHGAQYLAARDPEFTAQLQAWEALGLVAPWPANDPLGWVGVPTMNAIVKHMAANRNVSFEVLVKGLIKSPDSWRLYCDGANPGAFDAVIVAVPAEQAITLLGVHHFQVAKAALRAPSTACWTAMFAFPTPISSEIIVRDHGIIGLAARNSSKPGRGDIETWVVQAEGDWSGSHLEEEPDWVASHLLDELSHALGHPLPEPVYRTAHRWRYAISEGNGLGAIWTRPWALAFAGTGCWARRPKQPGCPEGSWPGSSSHLMIALGHVGCRRGSRVMCDRGASSREAQDAAVTIWYDGGCPLCQREIALMRRLDRRQRIHFVNLIDPAASCPLDRATMLERFHAMERGEMLTGAAAFAAMWRAIPLLRPFGLAARLPFVCKGLDWAYRFFLKLRPTLQRWLG